MNETVMNIALCAPIDIHSLAHACGQSSDGVAPGFGSTATTPLAIELLRGGHCLTVYTLSANLSTEQLYHWGKLRTFVGPSRQRHRARNFYRHEIDYLIRVIKADAPQFVHAHWTYEFALAAIRSGVPTVNTIHDLPWNVLMHFRDPYRFVRLLMAYQVALRGKYFTAVSVDAASHFRRYLNPRANITVIPNGLPDSIFELGAQHERQAESPIVFASILQGWTRLKNAKAALEAFAILRKQFPNAQFQMFGVDYEQDGPAHKWATQNGLDPSVTFVGSLQYQELLARIATNVDIIVHPSLNEAFSVTALEALALKKVFIAGKATTGMREMLDGGKAGMLVDVTNPTAIAEAMARVACDKTFREQVAQRGFDRASSLYRLSAVVSRYEAQYSSILQNANTAAVLSSSYT
jgi:glycosyltransferase involved in cell wall biosynthesis